MEKALVEKSVRQELNEYRKIEISKNPLVIFENAHKNNFFNEICEFFESDCNNLSLEHYTALKSRQGKIIGSLWHEYLDNEHASFATFEGIYDLVDGYVDTIKAQGNTSVQNDFERGR